MAIGTAEVSSTTVYEAPFELVVIRGVPSVGFPGTNFGPDRYAAVCPLTSTVKTVRESNENTRRMAVRYGISSVFPLNIVVLGSTDSQRALKVAAVFPI